MIADGTAAEAEINRLTAEKSQLRDSPPNLEKKRRRQAKPSTSQNDGEASMDVSNRNDNHGCH